MLVPKGAMRLPRHPYWPLLAVALNMAALYSVPASAQCLLCSSSGGDASTATSLSASNDAADMPLHIDVTADLDFSRLVAGDSGGSITIDPMSGQSRSIGAVSPLGGSGFSGRAIVQGSPGRTVRIELPGEVRLTSSQGGEARITDIISSAPPRAQLGPDGRLEFAFGGRLELNGTADGDYRGRVQITVSYE